MYFGGPSFESFALLAVFGTPCRTDALAANVRDDDAQDPAVDEEEKYAAGPQSWDEGRAAEKFELVALLKPECLADDPQDAGGDAKGGFGEEGGRWEVEWQENDVPEEVLEVVRQGYST